MTGTQKDLNNYSESSGHIGEFVRYESNYLLFAKWEKHDKWRDSSPPAYNLNSLILEDNEKYLRSMKWQKKVTLFQLCTFKYKKHMLWFSISEKWGEKLDSTPPVLTRNPADLS